MRIQRKLDGLKPSNLLLGPHGKFGERLIFSRTRICFPARAGPFEGVLEGHALSAFQTFRTPTSAYEKSDQLKM